MRQIDLAENLPTDKIQFTVDVITEKLVNANQLIQSARAHLENLVDPVVPNAYILGILDDAFMIVLGVQLLEAQNGRPELGPARWMTYQGRKWDREIIESLWLVDD